MMKRFLAALLFVGCLQAESLADFTGICTGGIDRSGVNEPQWVGFCHVRATKDELQIELSARGPLPESLNLMTGVKVFYRDDKGIAPPMMFVTTTDVCTFLVIPHDPEVNLDLIRYVASQGNPIINESHMRMTVEPTADDTPDTHKLLVRFIANAPIWYYDEESAKSSPPLPSPSVLREGR